MVVSSTTTSSRLMRTYCCMLSAVPLLLSAETQVRGHTYGTGSIRPYVLVLS